MSGLLASVEEIGSTELNRYLSAWDPKMGPLRRPESYGFWAYALVRDGAAVAVIATSTLVRSTCAKLSRAEALEVSRLCAARRDLCLPMLRLWRELIFPAQARPWAVSYQDADLHRGDVYRLDGWTRIGFSTSGTDPRGGVTASRRKVIWGWHADAETRAARRVEWADIPDAYKRAANAIAGEVGR